jgi:hypothetical protein
MVQVGYAGLKGTHLVRLGDLVDQIPHSHDNDCVNAPVVFACSLLHMVPNPMVASGNPFGPTVNSLLTGPVIFSGLLDKPFPEFFPFISIGGENDASSIYHALQASFQKRFGSGGTVSVAYTMSKLIGDTDTSTIFNEGGFTSFSNAISPQDSTNLKAERALSGFDVPQRAVISYVVDVPVGKGKRYLSNVSGVGDKLISGWGLNGITTLQSGFPLQLHASAPSAGPLPLDILMGVNFIGLRPNVVSACSKSVSGSATKRLNEWFNTSCFVAPPSIGYGDPDGNEGPSDSSLRSDGVANFDFSMFKDTQIAEKVKLEFRAEAYNLFNRVQFGPPGNTVGTSTFGVVSSQLNNPRELQFGLRLSF